MNAAFNADDMAEVRKQGDLKSLFAALMGKPAPRDEAPVEDGKPTHHIARPGAWPCGTAPTGPTPGAYCPDCAPANPGPATPAHRHTDEEDVA